MLRADDLAANLGLLFESIESAQPDVQAAMLKGILSGLEGRRNLKAPEDWSKLSRLLSASDNPLVRERSLALAQLFGDQAASKRALEIIRNTSANADRRRSMLSILLNQRNADATELLESLLDDPDLSLAAIRGFAMVEVKEAPEILLARYSKLTDQEKRAVVETLASRKGYAESLTEAVGNQLITPNEIPTHTARAMQSLIGKRFTQVYGTIPEVGEDRERLLAKYKKLCSPTAIEAADESRGRVVFQKTCAACHQLYGEGGKVGPDLTGSNRGNLDYILLNSVDPSYDVPDAYKTVTLLTTDGRVINGVLAEENSSRIVLKTPEEPRVVVPKGDIELRKISTKSMMPDGQLDEMKPQQVLDLIKYLRTTEQVEMPR